MEEIGREIDAAFCRLVDLVACRDCGVWTNSAWHKCPKVCTRAPSFEGDDPWPEIHA